jgi:hypothetical protein
MQTHRVPLRVIFYRDEDEWVAHCLEFDLVGSGETRQAALDCLNAAILTQLEFSVAQNNPLNLFSPAGGEYLEMFAAGKDIAEGVLRIDFDSRRCGPIVIEKTDFREYSDELVPA